MVWNLIITLNVLTSDLYPGSSLYRLGHSVVCSTDVQPPCRPAHTLTLCCLQYRRTAPLQTWAHTDTLHVCTSLYLLMFLMTILSECGLGRCLPVSYFLQAMLGSGLPVASQIIVMSSPAVTSRVLSHEWIYGGTKGHIITLFITRHYVTVI